MNTQSLSRSAAGAVLFLSLATAGFAKDFHVAPQGVDSNPGTKNQPFGTLAHARDVVRQEISRGLQEDVTVYLRGGVYELADTLAFGPADSGDSSHAITYAAGEGEKVVVSGGRRIKGWEKGADGIWSAAIPGAKDGAWHFRQLFVNGKRAIRARTPEAAAEQPCSQLKGATLEADLSKWTYQFARGQLKDVKNIADVECVVFGNWEITRKLFESVDAETGIAVMAPPHILAHDAIAPAADRFYHLENAREFLDTPGEWYLDRKSGVVSYMPRPGEDMLKADVIAPRLKHLVEINGTAGAPVRNLHFKGISFEHSDWKLPPAGYSGVQACHYAAGKSWNEPAWGMIDAAIRWEGAANCSIEGGALTRLGGCGIELAGNCRDCVIQGNSITDISGNGVQVGASDRTGAIARGCRVANNSIHDCGIDYAGAVGVWVGFAEGTVVAHNLIHTLPYSGISVGWQWNSEPTPCKNNTIEFNHIHHVMNRLGDGGGIYTLGWQPGTVIRSNLIHDVKRSQLAQAAPNNGMFIDEGSKGFLFESNVIYKTSGEPIRFNQCQRDWHTWKDNTLGQEAPCPKAGLTSPLAGD
jgi:hypothetical protein